MKGKAKRKKKHSVSLTVPTGADISVQGKVLISTCGGSAPGCS